MTYKETTEYLFNATPVFEHIGAAAYKSGLENTQALDEHFHHPHRMFKSIHVGGTNGKGSVSHTLASILQEEGFRVGLYTSPHLVDFRERIRVNGQPIPEQYVVDFVDRERAFFEPLHPSFFELTTALAFKYFSEQQIDIAVIEVGLGGRLDCTNIINPILSVITNISKDHTQFLGDTLGQIAAEKAGIMKSGTPVVVGEDLPQTRPVFFNSANRLGSPIVFAQDQPEVVSAEPAPQGGLFYSHVSHGKIWGELGGVYQLHNTNTVLKACEVLSVRYGLVTGFSSVLNGLQHVCRNTGLTGRWQKVGEKPLVICDTGHNVGGWQYLSRQIAAQPCQNLHMVFGMVDDKDLETVMGMLPKHAHMYYTQASTHRAIPVGRVEDMGQSVGLHGKGYATVADAYDAAMKNAAANDFVFVGGSSYVVADFISSLPFSPLS